MAAKKTPARRTNATRPRKAAARKPVARKPRRGGLQQRAALALATGLASQFEKHGQTVMSRKDAAILRETHQGCTTCHGNGQVYTQGKDGSFTGSKPCPAKPMKAKASRLKVALAARFGADRSTGLLGWTCPCGTKEKPRFRDAKDATKALRTHERKKHGGKTVGGAWYAQIAEGKEPLALPKQTPVSKPNSAPVPMTDEEWEKQNIPLSPAAARKKGVCWCCGGKGALYSAFGGQQLTTVCGICHGHGKPVTTPQGA